MTRTPLHHIVSTLAALALVSVFANSPASAQNRVKDANATTQESLSKKAAKGLATKKGSQTGTSHSTRESKGLTTQQRPPVACDCTNCSAEHCQTGSGFLETQRKDLTKNWGG
jgi:hypothetical protein